MSSLAMRSVYIVLAVITLATIVLSLRTRRGKGLHNIFLFYSAMAMGWQVVLIFKYTVTDHDSIRFLSSAILPFVALSSLAVLVFVLRFYGMEKSYEGAVLAGLCVCPAVTAALTLLGPATGLLDREFQVISVLPELIIEKVRGPWFWMHAVYSYVLAAAAICVALAKHRGLPRSHRATSVVLLAGMLGSIACGCLNTTGLYRTDIDLALVGVTFCGALMYAAAWQNHGLDYVYTARKGIFNSLGDAVFILDNDRRIISRNNAADALVRVMGLSSAVKRFDEVSEKIHPDTFVTGANEEELNGTDFFLAGDVYNLGEKTIYDRRQKPMGFFVLVRKVSKNRRMIRQLEEEAGMDSLTGLYNRSSMKKMLAALDCAENCPIGVICGDMNGLKEVNDTHGHQQGDVLLMAGAEALVSSCPPSACIGRMGGDEFMVLLPGYSKERVDELVGEIKERLRCSDEYAYEVSMALGAAVKTDASQSMEDIISLADGRMYENKRKFKAENGLRPAREPRMPAGAV